MSEYDKTRDDVTYIVVKDTVEHEDGSATYSFDLSDGARDDLANIGLEFVLYCAAARVDIQDAFKMILESAEVKPESPMSKPGDKDYEV